MNKNIAIIGAGVMGQAIAKGLLSKKIVETKNLMLTNIVFNGLETFTDMGVTVTGDNSKAINFADIVILAVKPQIIDEVLEQIKKTVKEEQLIISIAAGISINHIEKYLGVTKKIARVMPNLAASVGESISCWVINKNVSAPDETIVRQLLASIGKEILLENEEKIDSITPLSGSGPAYIFLLAEILMSEAVRLGIDEKKAQLLAAQTIIGSSKILEASNNSFSQLRTQVTSKGGVTQQAIQVLEQENIQEIFHRAIKKAYEKAKELNRT